MEFPFDIEINLSESGITGVSNPIITINGGLTTFLGPNGSGKTQLLKGLKKSLSNHANGKNIKYISAGRLGMIEAYRSNHNGNTNLPQYDYAEFGDKYYVKNRYQNETVGGDFATLSERPDILIKVQERLRKLFHRDIIIEWDAGQLKVYFAKIDDEEHKNYNSAREASGLLHLASLLTSIYDDEISCLLIDEPEVSLHPQLQSFLLNEIKKVAGNNTQKGKKLIFISTHSTEFIEISSVAQFSSIIFCKDIKTRPFQISQNDGHFQGKKLQALLTRLGQEHKLALFCTTPLLVEGPSDEIICLALSRKLELHIEAAGCQILPVTGKGQFPVVVELFRLIGKAPALIGDADAITDSLDIIGVFTKLPESSDLAQNLGHKDAAKFAKDIYTDFCQLVIKEWDQIKDKAEKHYYWIHRDIKKDEIIAKRRSTFCYLFNNSNEEIKLTSNDLLNIKIRLTTLLAFLETLGCFILRRGTIESYYQHSTTLTVDEKPNAASYEVNELMGESVPSVQESYGDIIRAMKYCSKTKIINEGEALRNLLLAVVSPILAALKKETTDLDLRLLATSSLGNKSRLFKLTKLTDEKDVYLEVGLESDILEVSGFPIIFKKGSNPIEIVNNALNLD
ncbi:AAA family ATPase [Flavobacterium circumlabens]|uniref:AAA family ATPase n=1 Tax=Flavobacterium circumlabens TaxID=2133765 RepID=A0A4Y7U8H6_9FLAO|nr:AAA family ATPase [Flavobacterium circumlabens]TCN53067.1 putative AbiEii toxin of type IV toxin-antitoxin system [Flavobacterium circumlabens]TEB42378.1 AAA family ATPase [Flavobacterium circumlabens]